MATHQEEPARPLDTGLVNEKPTRPRASRSDVESAEVVGEAPGPHGTDTDLNAGVPPSMGNLKWFSICVGLYLTAFLYGLDSTISAAVQGPILASLGDLSLLPWVGTGFLLGSVATISLFGSLYTRLEVKWLYLGSIVAFEAGSALCGAAPNMQAMAVGRVVAGIGGSGIYLGGISYISIFVSPAKRPFYTALISTFWGLGAILGPVIGGAFAQSNATWRWAFYINLVLGAITSPIYIFTFPRHGAHSSSPLWPRLANLDYLGAFLNAAVYSLFVTACTYSGAVWPWSSGQVIALWVATAVALLLYVLQQGFSFLTTAEDRIYPVWCLRSRSLVLLYLGTAGASAVLNCNVYYLPLYFELAKGDGPIAVAARMLPFIFLMIFGAMFSGSLLPKWNLYAAWYVVSGLVAVVGSALLMALVSTDTPAAHVYGLQVLTGLGCGLTFQAAYSIALVKVPPHLATSVLSFINVAQLGAGAMSLAIAGCVFQNVGFERLQGALGPWDYSPTELKEALGGGYSAIISDSPAEVRQAALGAIGGTITSVFGISIGGAATVLAAGMLMPWERVKMG